eukprot:TRINITY_DN2631_c0_g1_i2.p3 TRINITY_DN2631_c0_g1~~TRINITY_DN2631_c0_g1_i2.p3  ORF type:complete len:110 (-),score=39.47 TRINITY_DN2631_c0_g1_i2:1019-1348(-)
MQTTNTGCDKKVPGKVKIGKRSRAGTRTPGILSTSPTMEDTSDEDDNPEEDEDELYDEDYESEYSEEEDEDGNSRGKEKSASKQEPKLLQDGRADGDVTDDDESETDED